jgi:NTE family protein
VVRLLSPRLEQENHTKDIDFSPAGIRRRREAGHADTMDALRRQPWIGKFGLLDGVILHEPQPGAEPAAEIDPAEPCSGSVPDDVRKLAAE